MKPSQAATVIEGLVRSTNLSIYVSGAPGIGKSSIIHQVAAALGRPVRDIRAVLLDPVDLCGIPTVSDGQTHWAPPGFLPHNEDANDIIFLDELTQAPPMVQSACMQLVLDRRLREYVVPPNCKIIAAGNRTTDRAGVHRMGTALANRFIHIEVDADYPEWRQWAVSNGIRSDMLAFLAMKPTCMSTFDPQSPDPAFASPRSWEMASKAMDAVDAKVAFQTVAGCIGQAVTAELFTFIESQSKMPNLDTILKSPDKVDVPEDVSVIYAVLGGLFDRIRRLDGNSAGDKAILEAYAAYITRMPPEYAAVGVMDASYIHKMNMTRTKAAMAWMQKHSHMLDLASKPN